MTDPLRAFRRRRHLASVGILCLALGLPLPYLLHRYALLGTAAAIATGLLAAVIGVMLMRLYRCPYCGGDPERQEGVLSFDAVRCQNCGRELR